MFLRRPHPLASASSSKRQRIETSDLCITQLSSLPVEVEALKSSWDESAIRASGISRAPITQTTGRPTTQASHYAWALVGQYIHVWDIQDQDYAPTYAWLDTGSSPEPDMDKQCWLSISESPPELIAAKSNRNSRASNRRNMGNNLMPSFAMTMVTDRGAVFCWPLGTGVPSRTTLSLQLDETCVSMTSLPDSNAVAVGTSFGSLFIVWLAASDLGLNYIRVTAHSGDASGSAQQSGVSAITERFVSFGRMFGLSRSESATVARGVPVTHISVSGFRDMNVEQDGDVREDWTDGHGADEGMGIESATGKRWTLLTLDESMVLRKWVVNMSSNSGNLQNSENNNNNNPHDEQSVITARMLWSNDKLRNSISLSGAPTCVGMSFFPSVQMLTSASASVSSLSAPRLLICSAERPTHGSQENELKVFNVSGVGSDDSQVGAAGLRCWQVCAPLRVSELDGVTVFFRHGVVEFDDEGDDNSESGVHDLVYACIPGEPLVLAGVSVFVSSEDDGSILDEHGSLGDEDRHPEWTTAQMELFRSGNNDSASQKQVWTGLVDGIAGVTLVSPEHGMLGCELYGLEEINKSVLIPIAPKNSSSSAAENGVSGPATQIAPCAPTSSRAADLHTMQKRSTNAKPSVTASRPVSMLTSAEASDVFRRVLDAFITAASSGRNGLAAASQDTDFDDVMRLRQQELDAVVVDVATQRANQRPAQRWAELRAGDASFVDSFSPDLILRTLRSKREMLGSEKVGLVGFLMRTGLLQTLSNNAMARLRELDDKIVASIRLCVVHKEMESQAYHGSNEDDDKELILACMQDVVVMRTGYADASQLAKHLKVAGLAITDVFYAHVETIEDLLPHVSRVNDKIESFTNRIFMAILLAPTSSLRLECSSALTPPLSSSPSAFTSKSISTSTSTSTSNKSELTDTANTSADAVTKSWNFDMSSLGPGGVLHALKWDTLSVQQERRSDLIETIAKQIDMTSKYVAKFPSAPTKTHTRTRTSTANASMHIGEQEACVRAAQQLAALSVVYLDTVLDDENSKDLSLETAHEYKSTCVDPLIALAERLAKSGHSGPGGPNVIGAQTMQRAKAVADLALQIGERFVHYETLMRFCALESFMTVGKDGRTERSNDPGTLRLRMFMDLSLSASLYVEDMAQEQQNIRRVTFHGLNSHKLVVGEDKMSVFDIVPVSTSAYVVKVPDTNKYLMVGDGKLVLRSSKHRSHAQRFLLEPCSINSDNVRLVEQGTATCVTINARGDVGATALIDDWVSFPQYAFDWCIKNGQVGRVCALVADDLQARNLFDFLEEQQVNEPQTSEYDAVVQQLRWVVALQLKEFEVAAKYVQQEQQNTDEQRNQELSQVLSSVSKLAKWACVA